MNNLITSMFLFKKNCAQNVSVWRLNYFIFIVILFSGTNLYAQGGSGSSADTNKYPWIHPEINGIQFYNRDALAHFYESWKQSDKKKISVVELGDSHLQSDIYPGQLRKRMQEVHGDGGRGLMFSFSTAKTYSSIDYKTTHTGEWLAARSLTTRPKVPLGVRGMACRTNQALSSLSFWFDVPVPKNHNVLKLFCKKQHISYDLIVTVGDTKIPVTIDSTGKDSPFIAISIPPVNGSIKLTVVKSNPYETEFEFYGMSLETSEDKGAIVHNAGVGAARYQSILYEALFKAQLPALEPDVMIVDFGTNDYLYDDIIKPELEKEIRQVIKDIRDVCPQTSIILTTAQDLYWKKVNIKSGAKFAEMIHRIASETNCGVYDWYWISGGQKTMLNWVQVGLAQRDMIHLTMSGYRLKGNLFFEAMKSTIDWMDENPEGDSLIFSLEHLKTKQVKTTPVNGLTTPYKGTAENNKLLHQISKGETLYAISVKYGVTVAQIMEWNGLKDTKIIAGQNLIIHANKIPR